MTNEGVTAKVKGPTATNVSVQTSRPIKVKASPLAWHDTTRHDTTRHDTRLGVPWSSHVRSNKCKAGAEPFWYFEAAVDRKPPPWNIGFGIADSEWSVRSPPNRGVVHVVRWGLSFVPDAVQLEIKFVGFDKESFNYGYTSNGKMRATTQYEDFITYGQGDRVGFWLEYFYPGLDLTVHVFLNDVRVLPHHSGVAARVSRVVCAVARVACVAFVVCVVCRWLMCAPRTGSGPFVGSREREAQAAALLHGHSLPRLHPGVPHHLNDGGGGNPGDSTSVVATLHLLGLVNFV